MKKIFIYSLFLSSPLWAELDKAAMKSMETILKKYAIDQKLTSDKKFSLYATAALELEQFGFKEKASEYFKKAIELEASAPNSTQKFDLYTEYLFHLSKQDQNKAREFYFQKYKKEVANSDYPKKDELISFWDNHFSEEPKQDKPFFNQFYKDQKIKSYFEEKKYKEAFALVKDQQLKDANINMKLEYDTLATINHEKKQLYCLDMLNDYPDSYSIPVEICRYLKDGQLKYGDLNALEKRTKEEHPHLLYIAKALKDIK